MKVVLFCGGQGMRIRDYSDKVPKPMVPVGNRPILWHVMKYYAQFGHTDFILALGHKGEVIKEYFLNYEEGVSNDFVLRKGQRQMLSSDLDSWTVRFVDTGLMSEPGERLLRVQSLLEGEEAFLVNYADGLTDLDHAAYIEAFEASGKSGALTLVPPPHSYHVVDLSDGDPTGLTPMAASGQWINGGYFIFKQDVFDYLAKDNDMHNAMASMMADGLMYGNKFEGFWRPMDTFKEKQRLDSIFDSGDVPWLSYAG